MFKNILNKQFKILLISSTAIGIGFFFIYLLIIFLIIPDVLSIYKEFGAEMPILASGIFTLASIFTTYWFISVPLSILAIMLSSFVLAWVFRNTDVVTVVAIFVGLFFLGIALTFGLSLVGIYLPIYSLAKIV